MCKLFHIGPWQKQITGDNRMLVFYESCWFILVLLLRGDVHFSPLGYRVGITLGGLVINSCQLIYFLFWVKTLGKKNESWLGRLVLTGVLFNSNIVVCTARFGGLAMLTCQHKCVNRTSSKQIVNDQFSITANKYNF